MGLLTGRGVKEPPKVSGSAPAPPNQGEPVRTDSAPWLEIRQSLEGLRTGFSDMARFLQRIEQRMLNQDFDEQTVRVPGGAEGKAYKLPEGTAGIIVSAPSGSSLSTITIRHGLHVYTPNANSNPVFIPTTRTVREVVFYSSASAGTIIPVNVTALGYAAAQMWAATNGNVALTGSTGSDGNPATSTPSVGVLGFNGTTYDRLHSVGPSGDGFGNPSTGVLTVMPFNYKFNGVSWDRVYNNTQGTLLVSAARTAGANSATQTNFNARGVLIILNVTAASGTGGLQAVVYTLDPVSGQSVLLYAPPTAITVAGTYAYMVYPGASGATAGNQRVNVVSGVALPRQWFVGVGVGDSSSYTYSVGFAPIL